MLAHELPLMPDLELPTDLVLDLFPHGDPIPVLDLSLLPHCPRSILCFCLHISAPDSCTFQPSGGDELTQGDILTQ